MDAVAAPTTSMTALEAVVTTTDGEADTFRVTCAEVVADTEMLAEALACSML